MAFVGYGQNDSGGQALPAMSGSIVTTGFTFYQTGSSLLPVAFRGPQMNGVLYQQSGSVFTGGKGQIFPTGRS